MTSWSDEITGALRRLKEAREAEAAALEVLIAAAATQPASTPREFLSLPDVADLTGLAEQTIRNCITNGNLRQGEHYHKPTGGRLVFEAEAMRRWVRQPRQDEPPRALVGGRRRAR